MRGIRSEPANAGVTIIGVSSYAMPGDAQLFGKLRLHLGDDD